MDKDIINSKRRIDGSTGGGLGSFWKRQRRESEMEEDCEFIVVSPGTSEEVQTGERKGPRRQSRPRPHRYPTQANVKSTSLGVYTADRVERSSTITEKRILPNLNTGGVILGEKTIVETQPVILSTTPSHSPDAKFQNDHISIHNSISNTLATTSSVTERSHSLKTSSRVKATPPLSESPLSSIDVDASFEAQVYQSTKHRRNFDAQNRTQNLCGDEDTLPFDENNSLKPHDYIEPIEAVDKNTQSTAKRDGEISIKQRCPSTSLEKADEEISNNDLTSTKTPQTKLHFSTSPNSAFANSKGFKRSSQESSAPRVTTPLNSTNTSPSVRIQKFPTLKTSNTGSATRSDSANISNNRTTPDNGSVSLDQQVQPNEHDIIKSPMRAYSSGDGRALQISATSQASGANNPVKQIQSLSVRTQCLGSPGENSSGDTAIFGRNISRKLPDNSSNLCSRYSSHSNPTPAPAFINQPNNRSPEVCQPLPPSDHSSPNPASLPLTQHPFHTPVPAVTFTIDNRAESPLPAEEVQGAMTVFVEHCRVIIPNTNILFPIGTVMWQTLPDFYKWLSETNGAEKIGDLVFELVDVHWQSMKVFRLPEGEPRYFQVLKQHIWNLFFECYMRSPSMEFKVAIAPYTLNQKAPDWTAAYSAFTSLLENMSTVETRPTTKPTVPTVLSEETAPQSSQTIVPRKRDSPPTYVPQITNTYPLQVPNTHLAPKRASDIFSQPPDAISAAQIHSQGVEIVPERTSNPPATSPPIEIKIRLQKNAAGHFTPAFPKSVMRPKITLEEFFSFFSSEAKHPRASELNILRFTMKDAMPVARMVEIERGNEKDFRFLRHDIKAECEKARRWLPGLREFEVLVSVPGWCGEESGEDDDEW